MKIKYLAFVGCLLFANNAIAQSFDFKVDGTTPKVKIGDNIELSFSGRALFDTFSINNDFVEVQSQASRDEEFSNNSTRRLVWVLDAKLGSHWKFKSEQGFMGGKTAWDDAYFEYALPNLSLYFGQNYQTSPLEGQSSSSGFTFPNRSLMTTTFAQGNRNFGFAMRYHAPDWQISAGVFGDSINAPSERLFARSQLVQVRGSYSPIHTAQKTIHIGGSIRYRTRDDDSFYSYSLRPIQYAVGTQYLQTGAIAQNDMTYGIEGFYANGPFSIEAEAQTLVADTNGGNLNFNGAYLEAVYFFTGETRNYNSVRGVLAFPKVKKSVMQGGAGAVSLAIRLDYLDLSDGNLGNPSAPISSWRNRGGIEKGYSIGLNWYPTNKILIRSFYSRSEYEDTRGFTNSINGLVSNPLGKGHSDLYNIRWQIMF